MISVPYDALRAPEGSVPAPRPPRARMAIAVLAEVGILVAGYLTLTKLGYFGGVQCGVGSCEVVQASRYAVLLGAPVALWGVAAYALLLGLALVGAQPRWRESRGVALGLFGVAAASLGFSGYLTYLEAFVIRAWCQWCVVSAVLVALIFLLSLPGLRRGLHG